MAQKGEKYWQFSMSLNKLVTLEKKLMRFAQYQNTGVKTWYTGFQAYQEQYE